MVKHVILWQLKDDIRDKEAIKENIKKGLEALKGVIPGLLEIKVYTQPLAGSNADLALDSLFESEQALREYATHPEHVKVADGIVRPNVAVRMCMDYEV